MGLAIGVKKTVVLYGLLGGLLIAGLKFMFVMKSGNPTLDSPARQGHPSGEMTMVG